MTRKVTIVTDSAAALPDGAATADRVVTVPMQLSVGGRSEPEGIRSLAELLAQPDVTTSAPAPGDFARAVDGALVSSDGVLVMTVASSVSATYDAARAGVVGYGDAVRVVDTRTAAGAQALVVLRAAEVAERGATLKEVEAQARVVIDRVRLIAVIPGLDHLARSGRIPGLAARVGRRLDLRPMFEFRDGAPRRLRPALSHAAAMDRLVESVFRSRSAAGRLHVVALHAQAPEEAAQLLALVTARTVPATALVGEFGPVMVVHTGSGVIGLAWWWEEERSSVGSPDAQRI